MPLAASVLGQRVSELDSVCERMTSMVDCLRSRTEEEESTMNQNVEHADSWRDSLKEHCRKTKVRGRERTLIVMVMVEVLLLQYLNC